MEGLLLPCNLVTESIGQYYQQLYIHVVGCKSTLPMSYVVVIQQTPAQFLVLVKYVETFSRENINIFLSGNKIRLNQDSEIKTLHLHYQYSFNCDIYLKGNDES